MVVVVVVAAAVVVVVYRFGLPTYGLKTPFAPPCSFA